MINLNFALQPVSTEAHNIVYDYQTLLTGLLALAAAIAAVIVYQKQLRALQDQISVGRDQIKAVKAQADRERAGRLRAARATLSATLSGVCDYASDVGQQIHAAWPAAARTQIPGVGPKMVHVKASIRSFPPELLAPLERLVEVVENEGVADRVESMLREAQVLAARTRNMSAGVNVSSLDLAVYVLQAASIYARAASLFPYARREKDDVSEQSLWNGVATAVSVMEIHETAVDELAERMKARGIPPGNGDRKDT